MTDLAGDADLSRGGEPSAATKDSPRTAPRVRIDKHLEEHRNGYPSLGLIDIIRSELERHSDKIVFAYLFGSHARGDVSPLSDVDLAVYFSRRGAAAHAQMKIELYTDLSRALKRNDLDVVVLNTAANLMLIEQIIHDGIVVLDNDPRAREDYEVRKLHEILDFKAQR